MNTNLLLMLGGGALLLWVLSQAEPPVVPPKEIPKVVGGDLIGWEVTVK